MERPAKIIFPKTPVKQRLSGKMALLLIQPGAALIFIQTIPTMLIVLIAITSFILVGGTLKPAVQTLARRANHQRRR
jgi:hypothetical protein